MTFVHWLNEICPDDPTAGGKMSRLADLARAGLDVPEAFVVTSAAYQTVADGCGLPSVIERALAGIGPDDLDELAEAETRIREHLAAAPVPAEITDAIAEAYEDLCVRRREVRLPVAVRSSSSTEDAVAASSAGQYDTYLGLAGTAAVIDGVRRCWGSLFGARALGYRMRHDLSHADSPMAVGVVELVQARASGVAFSVNPVTGRRDRLVVEATFGYGEALVQGLVNPDHVEIGRTDRRVLSYKVGDKRIVSTMDHQIGQVVEVEMPASMQRLHVLDAEEIDALVDAVMAAEEMLGQPADVEWVLARHRRPGDPATLVQVRPVTTAVEPAQTPLAWNPAASALKYAFMPGRPAGGQTS